MNAKTSPLSRQQLIEKANALISEHDDYFAGVKVSEVEQNGHLLVFRGDYFLDENGLPTAKSTAVFNIFKALTVALSEKYHLAE
ncbi:DUF2498 family protein [Mixta intestinalis]|jgi:hypothetical protein|uniref:Protein YciN n=1 Tax=Mixta intestinalis TaxID=1615494 RepID=A0A6P1PYB3_9GAMM|nr:DUF2498 family protein [Mixta intestinalis]QHM71141.1 hypothetical protein C7M51_01424 [Mixta intestinalis]